MIRSGMSVPTNIVEGNGQKSGREFARFIGYAINSSSELEYHLVMARDIRAITAGQFKSLLGQLVEVRKMLHGLQKSAPKRDRGASPIGTSRRRVPDP